MRYRLLLCDIDGTLRPVSADRVPEENVRAIQAVQAMGVRFAIATGRGSGFVPEAMLNGLVPDFRICSAGGQVLDRDGEVIAASRFSPEVFSALLTFCTAEGYPLHFAFPDATYAYTGYRETHRWELERERATGLPAGILNGEDQTRHLREMPFAAASLLPRRAAAEFRRRYPDLGVRFLYYDGLHCDILQPGQDKARGLAILAEARGFRTEECVFVGDGENDAGAIRAAGFGCCVRDGAEEAKRAADWICPEAEAFGVAAVCREVWPEAFSTP